MVRGILIPAVPLLPVQEREFESLKEFQDAVGGFIEPISIAEPALTMYVNEDGKSHKMSLNERATALWWLFAPHVRGRDLIVGDVVLLPDEDGAGRTLLAQLLAEDDFRVEVQLGLAAGEWIAGDRAFPTWFEAAKFALVLEQRFEFVAAARVRLA